MLLCRSIPTNHYDHLKKVPVIGSWLVCVCVCFWFNYDRHQARRAFAKQAKSMQTSGKGHIGQVSGGTWHTTSSIECHLVNRAILANNRKQFQLAKWFVCRLNASNQASSNAHKQSTCKRTRVATRKGVVCLLQLTWSREDDAHTLTARPIRAGKLLRCDGGVHWPINCQKQAKMHQNRSNQSVGHQHKKAIFLGKLWMLSNGTPKKCFSEEKKSTVGKYCGAGRVCAPSAAVSQHHSYK